MTELNPETFDAIAVAQGRSYPKDTVHVYMDHEAAHLLHKGEEDISRTLDKDAVAAWEQERKALVERVKGSALIFELQGLSQKAIKAIEDQADAKFGMDDDTAGKNDWRNKAFLAAHIARVTNAAGATDPNQWDAERVEEFEGVAPQEEYGKLFTKMLELTFKAAYFEQVEVSPDFS